MTTSQARDRLKEKLDISGTDLDTLIDHCIEDAVPRLAPWFQDTVAVETALMANDNKVAIASTAILAESDAYEVKRFYLKRDGTNYQSYTNYIIEDDSITLDTSFDTTIDCMYILHVPYSYATTFAKIKVTALPALFLFAMAEFATVIVGQKRKFNIYQQTNGTRSVQEMREWAEWCENRAIRICEDAISVEGM